MTSMGEIVEASGICGGRGWWITRFGRIGVASRVHVVGVGDIWGPGGFGRNRGASRIYRQVWGNKGGFLLTWDQELLLVSSPSSFPHMNNPLPLSIWKTYPSQSCPLLQPNLLRSALALEVACGMKGKGLGGGCASEGGVMVWGTESSLVPGGWVEKV